MITLGELLRSRGFDPTKRCKIIRHADKRIDLGRLLRRDRVLFEAYQADQSKPVFACDQIITCVKTDQGILFVGCFAVMGCVRGSHPRLHEVEAYCQPGYRLGADKPCEGGYLYDLQRCADFADLEERVLINWGDGALAWHQHYRPGRDKEVVAILPAGYVMPWHGYLDVLVDRCDLQRMARHPHANHHWIGPLTASGGVYCIQHVRTGELYVGSAAGERGLWGRWEAYAANGHGGNARLISRIAADPTYADDLRYSILHVLPRHMAINEILAYEALYKRKLGSRAYGLNGN